MELRQQIRKLWEECFEDSPQFLDFYFQDRYMDNYNHDLFEGDEVIASMQVYPYQLKLQHQQLKAGYIYGACTSPRYRNQGVMGRLMAQVMQRLYEDNYDLLFLIPASDSLYHFYSKFDFYTSFYQQSIVYKNEQHDALFQWQKVDRFNMDDFHFVAKHEAENNYRILHSVADYQTILTDIHIAQGGIFKAIDKNGNVVAIILTYPSEDNKTIIKGYYGAYEKRALYLSDFCHYLSIPEITLIASTSQPNPNNKSGMIRLLHPEKIDSHELLCSSLPSSFFLEDKMIHANNHLYSTAPSDKKNAVHLSMIEYTAKLFESTSLYMNWMMD